MDRSTIKNPSRHTLHLQHNINPYSAAASSQEPLKTHSLKLQSIIFRTFNKASIHSPPSSLIEKTLKHAQTSPLKLTTQILPPTPNIKINKIWKIKIRRRRNEEQETKSSSDSTSQPLRSGTAYADLSTANVADNHRRRLRRIALPLSPHGNPLFCFAYSVRYSDVDGFL